MKNMIILVWQRFQRSKITATFFIIGYAISMLLISINTSFVSQHLNAAALKKKFTPPNGTQYVVSAETSGSVTKADIDNLLKGLRSGTGVIFNGLETHPDKDNDVNGYYPVSAEYLAKDTNWHYPLVSGRYYTVKELSEGKKVALIGKSLDKYVEKKEEKEFICLGGTDYEVIGRIGNQNGLSLWDNRVFLPYSALPEDTQEYFMWASESLNMVLYNKKKGFKKDLEVIQKNGEQLKSGFEIEKVGKLEVEDMVSDLMNNMDDLYIMAVLGYLATLIYAVNILMYWLQKMRFEIGLRKACGYTNGKIFWMLFQEILGMSFIACFLAFAVQKFAGVLINSTGIDSLRFSLSIWNIVVALLITVISTFIILILPCRKLAKINPVEILRGE